MQQRVPIIYRCSCQVSAGYRAQVAIDLEPDFRSTGRIYHS